MKKVTSSILIALAVCLGFSCDNKGGGDNYSTPTEEIGSGEGDEISVGGETDAEAARASDSAEISTGAPATYVYISDQDFVTMAASGGMLEVELGKVAEQKGNAADVKKFGQHMVTDHTKANNELKTLAGKKKWTVPASMNAEHQAAYDRISKMTGQDFDREYMSQMVMDHEKTVAMFEKANQKAQDTDLKAFASKTLPTLRMHLDMARENNNKIQGM